ncbi:uncharacterized protein FIBRA_07976 [Fibroporia radiculosa]|uniref:P-loop containing nucleoside triphosphate hydrolase protein n=1 Tax=Fibroporia radiculosa TaxID=599839 RepID=J4H4X4_9APHY|nr:uncharacterized protein FIBRA_07976 [Fibroporia radiculosa]CCM05744.1 predicted protein [Fibroporia radiculosa]
MAATNTSWHVGGAQSFKFVSDVSQAVLSQHEGSHSFLVFELLEGSPTRSVYLNAFFFPAYAAVASAIIAFVHGLLLRVRTSKLHSTGSAGVLQTDDLAENNMSIVGRQGSVAILAFNVARALACLALLSMSLYSIITMKPAETYDIGLSTIWPYVGLCGTFTYTFVVALITVLAKPATTAIACRHLNAVLFTAWVVYVYRDVWPLVTFTLTPVDTGEGLILWAKVVTLTFAAVVVPLLVPRRYVPANSIGASMEPGPEQTASLLSVLLTSWLDKTVIDAYRLPHLPVDRFPPLADSDHSQFVSAQASKELDPFQLTNKGRNIGWGLIRVFPWEILAMTLAITANAFTHLFSPLAIKNLLSFMETRGEGAIVRPWIWAMLLFLGPLLRALTFSMYTLPWITITTHTEAILTHLIFNHALHMRMRAEISETQTTGDSAKGKQKSGNTSSADNNLNNEQKQKNATGKINNLITSDLGALKIVEALLLMIWGFPLQIILNIYFLYIILGWSAFAGLATIVLLFPVPGKIASYIETCQKEKMKQTDARVQNVTESITVIRMIKMFGWESKMMKQVTEKRELELKWLKRSRLLGLVIVILNRVIPLITMIVTYSTHTIIFKRELTASAIFSSIAVFEMTSIQMQTIFAVVPGFIKGKSINTFLSKVSLDRINSFLQETELLDEFADSQSDDDIATVSAPPLDSDVIGFRNAAFTWESNADGTSTPGSSRRTFSLRIEGELFFKLGCVNLIVGPTGAGKTSILMALLGEMHYIPSGSDSFFSLPREGGIAYAAQESWVQNETIRDNILFGAPYDEERYKKVIDQCGLKRDLDLFDAGDQTEVGERGITLSGGQKARVTLARAIYSHAEIILLDDVLAALDVHTARWIVNKCLKGDLVRGRTILLVTHNLALTSSIAQFVVDVGSNGQIVSQGTMSEALEQDDTLAAELAKETEELEKVNQEVDQEKEADAPGKSDGKLVVAEEISVGHLGWSARAYQFVFIQYQMMTKGKLVKPFLVAWGGSHFYVYWIVAISWMLLFELTDNLQPWYLGYWARQYEHRPPADVDAPFYLSIYGAILLTSVVCYCVYLVVFVFGSLRASRTIHKNLMATLWFDRTPVSRVVARCTQDIDAVDGNIPDLLETLVAIAISMVVKLAAIVIMSPVFFLPGIILVIMGRWLGNIYMKAQLPVKREGSNARAPVLGHFGAAFAGLVSIRAYGAQDAFRKELSLRIDRCTRTTRLSYNLNRWAFVRTDSLASLFSAGLGAYLVYSGSATASNTGFSLSMAVGFSGYILFAVRMFNQFEVAGNSLERIQQYMEIEQEDKPTESGVPPAYWPASGDLKVEKLSARYSSDGSRVLENVSFEVKSGERVGIVGRTGSGKSSLTLALLRCILTEGKVYYDGLPTDDINLDALRSSITIIPQIPELLSGTLRQNLDPFGQYDDAVLNDALQSAGLFSVQNDSDDSRITLDSEIASAGGNLSVGQRQILALARAILRQSKLLILDEATSAIDYATDAAIQASLRREMNNGVTILAVAHRLQTIMDADKIMVLDAGRIVEFGKPSELLQNEDGMLRALVEESGDKAGLLAMAAGAT